MIKEALEFLYTKFSYVGEKQIADRYFIQEAHAWREVIPPTMTEMAFVNHGGAPLGLGTIDALIAFVNSRTEQCQVVVGSRYVKAHFSIEDKVRCDQVANVRKHVEVPLNFPDDHDPMTFPEFQNFLDQHADRIKSYDELAAAVRFFKVNEAVEVKVEERGAIIAMSTIANKGVEGSANQVPKSIVIAMPTGTREFLINNTFLLRITNNKGLTFTLTKKEHDGSREAFIEAAMSKLKAGLRKGVALYEGV